MEIKNELIDCFLENFESVYTGSISQWAKENVELPSSYAIQGSFDISISPYLHSPMSDLKDYNIRQINLIGATQTGKTLVEELFIPYIIINDAGPILKVSQSDEMAQLFAETRLLPLLKNCKPTRNMLEYDRFSATKTAIHLPHMFVVMTGAKENIQHGQTIRYLLLDEAWLYQKDTIEKLKARTTAFGNNKKILITSQPGIEGDALDGENTGIVYEWAWKCPSCGNLQPWYWSKQKDDGSWAGIVWDKYYTNEESSSYDFQKTADSARLQCFHCSSSFKDEDKLRKLLNDKGEYIKIIDSGDNHVRTYTWGAFVNLKISFKEKVIQYLQAVVDHKKFGLTDKLRIFHQQVLGKPWKRLAAMDQTKVLTEAFNPDEDWKEQIFRCISVDYQKKYGMKYYAVVAFSKTEMRILEHGFCLKWDDIQVLAEKYKISPPAVCVDSGYNASEVYLESYNRAKIMNFGRRVEKIGWTCLKGDDADDGYKHKALNNQSVTKYYSPMIKPAITNTQFTRLFRWANGPIKNILYWIKEGKSDIKMILPVADEEFTKQLNSETLQEVTDTKTGLKKLRWIKISDDNHYFDVMAQSIVMCMMAGKFNEPPVKLTMSSISGSVSK